MVNAVVVSDVAECGYCPFLKHGQDDDASCGCPGRKEHIDLNSIVFYPYATNIHKDCPLIKESRLVRLRHE